MGDENSCRLTLDQRIKIQEEINSLTQPVTGKWLLLNPTEAVIEAIKAEKELKRYLAEHKTFITLAGNIGLGKTTFARIMSYGLDIEGCYELDAEKDHINDELLAKFLGDKPTYCFQLQQHLLAKRLSFRQRNAAKSGSCVEDRTPEEDPIIFHQFFYQLGYLAAGQVEQLKGEALAAYRSAPHSDLMIVLHGSPGLSRLRILQRGRPEELTAWRLEEELRPLSKLYDGFSGLVKEYGLHSGPILAVDLDRIDITNRVHEGYIYERILNCVK